MGYQGTAIQTAVMVASIAAWGFWEYRERDIRHKKAILDLRNNIESKAGSHPNWGKVATTVATSTLLVAMIIGGLIFVNRIGLHYAGPVLMFVTELMLVAILLLLMALRDAGILRKG